MKTKLLIIIPKVKYDLGVKEIISHVDKVLLPYCEETNCAPYIVKCKDDITTEYEEYKDEYPDINEYCMKYHAGYLDENGNLVSTINNNAFWDMYEICDIKYWYNKDLDKSTTGDDVVDNCISVNKLTEYKNMCLNSIDMIFDTEGNMFNVKSCATDIDNIFSKNENEYILYLECQ